MWVEEDQGWWVHSDSYLLRSLVLPCLGVSWGPYELGGIAYTEESPFSGH